jgi:cytochrome c-type biogenesis protein CcmH/NrfG
VIALFLALALQQSPQLEAEMQVDYDRIPVGGEIVLTIRAQSTSSDPIQISLPPLAGLELIARSERSEVSAGVTIGRTTVLELRVRGSMPGKWRVGPAKIRQGRIDIETETVEIEVTGSSGSTTATASSIGPNVQRLLAQSRPPRTGRDASVAIILSSSSAFVGEQVDVVTAAWFPRELRLQLRRPPTVQTPSIDGVYSYPQRSPTGIAASRQVDGHWFDLFVVHQIVFPLTPGRIRVPPATLHYSVPLAFQFFSQEERYAVHSESVWLDVRQLPAEGRPAAFTGGVAHGLTIERNLTPRSGRAGEPFTVDIVVRGEGNVPLWPPPPLDWPSHLRAYSEKVNDAITTTGGRLGGAKTFRYLVIPDSARTAGLPTLVYSYFDPITRSYASAQAPSLSYLVAPAREAAVSRATPAALKLDDRPPMAVRLLESVPRWLAACLLFLPPMLVLIRRPTRRKVGRNQVAARKADPIAHVEEELTRALEAIVPRLPNLEGEKLESALRAVGVESEVARQAVGVRERVRAARYGPVSEPDRKALLTEARALVERLAPAGAADRTRRTITAALVFIGLTAVPGLRAQTMAPEQLYEHGALNAAASAFAQRARLQPDVTAHWFNLGASRFRMGAAGAALAAWSRAERLAPRDPSIRRALRLVPAPESRSARALWVPPVTPEELVLLAGVLWFAGWGGYVLTRRNRWLVVVVGGLLAAGAAEGLTLWYDRPLGIVTADNSLSISPHDLAPAVAPVQVGSVVTLLQRTGSWAMVREVGGKVGWLPLESVEEL